MSVAQSLKKAFITRNVERREEVVVDIKGRFVSGEVVLEYQIASAGGLWGLLACF